MHSLHSFYSLIQSAFYLSLVDIHKYLNHYLSSDAASIPNHEKQLVMQDCVIFSNATKNPMGTNANVTA